MRFLLYVLHQCRRQRRSAKVLTALGVGFLIGLFISKHPVRWKNSSTNLKLNWGQDFVRGFRQAKCTEKTNFVYIKMIKCASSTIAKVLRRYGYTRNLTFVLPPHNRIYIGWPYEIDDTLYRPLKTTNFNILCEHSIYNRSTMSRIMPSDTIYITSLREPFSQFKSMLNYYNVFNISGIKSEDPFTEYIEHVLKYEKVYKSHEAAPTRYCIPDGFSMTRNLMSYNLGYPTGFLPGTKDMSGDLDFARDWIRKLDGELNLVLLTEYFHESMVLLRRLMCWSLSDILFSASNALKYNYLNKRTEKHVETYRRWSKVDHLLYEHFNETFWRRIHNEKEDFWEEVHQFRRINEAVIKFCGTSNDSPEYLTMTVPESRWCERLTISASFCRLIDEDLLPKLQENYENLLPKLDEPPPSKKTC